MQSIMPKRKHADFEEDSPSGFTHREDRKGDLQATRLRHKFERGSQLLHRALKTARGFERQKLGRRQRVAKQNDDQQALGRLEAEVQALKTLDLFATAERHLFKQLVKTKRIAESPAFARLKGSTSVSINSPRDVAETNVTARLFKSNPVKNAMPGIIAGIRDILGLEDVQTKWKGHAKDSAPVGEETREIRTSQDERKLHYISSGNETNGENCVSGDVSMDDVEPNIDFAVFDPRIGSSESGSDVEGESAMRGIIRSPDSRNRTTNLSLSLSPSPSISASESSQPSKGKDGKAYDAPGAQTKATTFLPSLMMGGYWSGSESGGDEDISDIRPRRKNRMGQQARRALWEKKYGGGANHIQNQKQKEGRDRGWDSRKGAMDDHDDPRGKRGKGKGNNNAQASYVLDYRLQREENSKAETATQRKKPLEKMPLHPSWEAARRAKEQKAQASFQGKKIIFD
ncbi:Bud-site selection protein [Elaphomyces granulatus]|jgi:hypothetical protein